MVNDFAELGTAPGGPPTIVERLATVEAAEGERDPRGDDHKEATGHGGHINRRGTASRDALAPVAAPALKFAVREPPHGGAPAAPTRLDLVEDHHRYLLSIRSTATAGRKMLSPQEEQRKCSSSVDEEYPVRVRGCSQRAW